MSDSVVGLLFLARAIARVSHSEASGTLLAHQAHITWRLEFYQGKLVCATGSSYRVRRWQRALLSQQLKVADLMNDQPLASYEPWEYALLSRAVMEGQVDGARAQDVLAGLTLEALTQIAGDATVRVTWEARSSRLLDCAVSESGLALSGDRLQGLLKESRDLSHLLSRDFPTCEWLDRGLRLEPDRNIPDQHQQTTLSLQPLFNGQRTFWDLARKLNQSPTTTARMLGYFFRREMIALEVLPDREPQPVVSGGLARSAGQAPVRSKRDPLVACIDDSTVALQRLERIVTRAGYRFYGLRDSMRALAQLIELKPDLILLDLVMPVVNGYEICAQIRRVKALEHTPIVILTGHDGAIDRVRAKLVRASDFLSKISDSNRILETVERHLQGVPPTDGIVRSMDNGQPTEAPC